MSSRHSFASSRHTVFLRIFSADKLQLSTSQSSFCMIYVGDTPVVDSSANVSNHHMLHTKVTTSKLKTTAHWNEKFEVPVDNIKKQILSVRVKSQHQVYSPSIGSCAIPLKQLKIGSTVDQNFPLFKGSTQVGTIRMQMMIRDNYPDQVATTTKESTKEKVKEPKVVKRVSSDQDAKQQRQPTQLQREQAEKDEQERQRKQREKLEQEKLRIEREMERLRVEEEERVRRRFEDEERRLLEEERLAVEKAQKERERDEKRRRKEQAQRKDHELIKKAISTGDNQLIDPDNPNNDSFDGEKRAISMRRSRDSRESHCQPTPSLRYMMDDIVRDALPSDDSDSSSDELDTEDEHEYIRQMAKLKMKMLEQKRLRKSMHHESRHSSTTGNADRFDLVTKKYRNGRSSSPVEDETHRHKSKSSRRREKHAKSKSTSNQDQPDMILGLTPGLIPTGMTITKPTQAAKKAGVKKNDEQSSIEQLLGTAVTVASVVCGAGVPLLQRK